MKETGAEPPVDDPRRELERALARLDRLQAQNDALADRLIDAEQAYAAATGLVEETRTELIAREAEVEALQVAVQETRIEELDHQLSALLSSESWRLTAPLRTVGRALRALVGTFSRRRVLEAVKPFVPVRLRRYVRRRFPSLAYTRPRADRVRPRRRP